MRLRNFNVECFSDFISLYILTLDEPFFDAFGRSYLRVHRYHPF